MFCFVQSYLIIKAIIPGYETIAGSLSRLILCFACACTVCWFDQVAVWQTFINTAVTDTILITLTPAQGTLYVDFFIFWFEESNLLTAVLVSLYSASL